MICLHVCLLDTCLSSAKTTELNEVPCRMGLCEGSRTTVCVMCEVSVYSKLIWGLSLHQINVCISA